MLNHERNGRFEELVLSAPPQVLGSVRKAIGKSVRDRIVGELDKDLTSHPVAEIEAHILKHWTIYNRLAAVTPPPAGSFPNRY